MTLSDLRGLEQVATQAQRGEKFERRVFEVKAEAPASASSVATSPAGFAKAKQLLKAKQEADARASMRGSQKEEAMRKLHAAGVVSAKQAFGTKSKTGTQHAEAIKALAQRGGHVQVGASASDRL